MGILGWLSQNWLDLVQTAVITSGLLFTAISLRDDTSERRIENLLLLTQNHRELWSNVFTKPELARVFDESIDLVREPMTAVERVFVTLVIQHLHSAFQAITHELVVRPAALRRDVGEFFSAPIPNAVWSQVKDLQNEDFVAFVESSVELKQGRTP